MHSDMHAHQPMKRSLRRSRQDLESCCITEMKSSYLISFFRNTTDGKCNIGLQQGGTIDLNEALDDAGPFRGMLRE
eukprot:766544-Hanusia_phi.AAC.8